MSKPKRSVMKTVRAIFKRPSEFNIETALGIFEVKPNHMCDMCGEALATCVIHDPNIFPANDVNNREHFWDVCGNCREFVNWGLGKSYEVAIEVALDKAKANKTGV